MKKCFTLDLVLQVVNNLLINEEFAFLSVYTCIYINFAGENLNVKMMVINFSIETSMCLLCHFNSSTPKTHH